MYLLGRRSSTSYRHRFGALLGVLAVGTVGAGARTVSPVSGNQCKKTELGRVVGPLACVRQGTKIVWVRVVASVAAQSAVPLASSCDPNYTPCVPIASDVDCSGGTGNGPAYVQGPVTVIGSDIYGLDRDGNGIGCEGRN